MTSNVELIKCPNCQSEIVSPGKGESRICKACGCRIQVDLIGNSFVANEACDTASDNDESPQRTSECEHKEVSRHSVLDDWKTSVGFSILGLILAILWAGLGGIIVLIGVNFALPHLPANSAIGFASAINGLLYQIVCLVYALVFYPSYFKNKPLIKSGRMISCLNFLFGNVIFGPIWNRNLTNKKKGISYSVFAVFAILNICSIGILIATLTPQYVALNELRADTDRIAVSASSAATTESSSKSIEPQTPSYSNEDAGFAIDFPSKPEVTLDDQSEINAALFYLELNTNSEGLTPREFVQVDYVAVPLYENKDEENEFLASLLPSRWKSIANSSPNPEYFWYYKIQGMPAISYMARGVRGFFGLAIVHSEEKIYYIGAVTETEEELSQFIDSFTLI